MIPGKQYTPELVLAILWRRKWLIVIPAVLIAIGVAVYTYRLPDLYQASTLVQVVPQKVPENYVRPTVTQRIDERLRSINQEVRTRTRLERVIEENNLYPERRKTDIMQDIVEDMSRNIGVDVIQGDLFRVAFTSDNPRTAQQVTDKLASFFIDESTRDRAGLAEGTSQFLETELDEAKRKLVETEQRLVEYRRAHNGELPTQVDSNMQGMNSAQMQLQEVRRVLATDRERQVALERGVIDLTAAAEAAAASGEVAGPPTGSAVELAQTKEALRQMLLEKKPDHPDVNTLRRRVEKLEKEVAEQRAATTPLGDTSVGTVNLRTRALEDARRDLKRVQDAIAANTLYEKRLSDSISEYVRRMAAAPVRDSELTEMVRDYGLYQQQYYSLLGKRLDSQMSANLERRGTGEQFKILDPARLPEKPFYPNRPRLYLIGVFMAIAVGLALAGAAEYLDRAMRSEDDIRLALALPVLATIPDIDATKTTRRGRLVAASSAAAVIAIGVAVASWWVLR